ncbi:MAG: DNA-binding response regulator, partial [Chloroflexi bacterium]|nr:DNA-binding response regulator [Chloroflexota bacterium]
TIRYHIYRIRKKIREATGQEDIIETVRGIGYAVR